MSEGETLSTTRNGADALGERTSHYEEEMPRVVVTRRQAIAFGLFVLTIVGFMYFVLPKLAGVGATLHHLENGDGWWIATFNGQIWRRRRPSHWMPLPPLPQPQTEGGAA